MTLILAAVKSQFAVIASDGLEFTHATDGSRRVSQENYQKLFPLPLRRVLAVHGQNRLHSDEHPGGREISAFIAENDARFRELRTVRTLAEFLRDLIDPFYEINSEYLVRSGLSSGALKVIVIGLDAGGDQCLALENLWLPGRPTIIADFDCRDLRLFHAGSGELYALQAVGGRTSPLHPITVANGRLDEVRDYVRRLYQDAAGRQPADDLRFGGLYQCVTLNRSGWRWQEGAPTA